MDNKTKVVISGYYGFNNIGDEAILYTMIEMLNQAMPNVSITVLSNNPKETEKTYGVEAVSRWDMRSIVKHLKACDMLISGGGSLLQDVTSSKTIPYYLGIVKLGLFFKKKVVFYSQGIGPVNQEWNRWMIKNVASQVEHIFVREGASGKLLEEIGVSAPISVAIDPVFGIHLDEALAKKVAKKVVPGKKVGIYLRPWTNDEQMVASVCVGITYLIEQGYDVYMLCMQYDKDIEIAKKVMAHLVHEKLHLVDESLSVDETLAYTAQFDFILSMRLHSLIMGVAVDTPTIALSYDPKVENVMGEMGVEHSVKVEDLTGDKLIEMIQWVECHLTEEKEKIRQMREKKIDQIYSPIRYIKNCLEGSS